MAWARRVQVAAAAGIGTTQTITGLPGTPAAIIALCALRATDDGTVVPHMQGMFGAAANDGNVDASVCWGSEDALPSSDTNRVAQAGALISLATPQVTQGLDAYATVTAWNTDGFTLTWSAALDGAWLIEFLVFGGIDATLRPVTMDNTNNNLVVSGLGFETKAVVAFAATSPGGTTSIHAMGLGSWDGATIKQSCATFRDGDAAATMSAQHQRSNEHIWRNISATPTVTGALTIAAVGGDSITFGQPVANAGSNIWMLLLGGDDLDAHVDTVLQRTSVGTTSVTAPGFQPDALLGYCVGWTGNASAGGQITNTNHVRHQMGIAADGDGQATLLGTSQDNVADSRTQRAHLGGAFFRDADVVAGTEVTRGAVQSYDANGYTLNWSVVDVNARENVVLALKLTPSGGVVESGAVSLSGAGSLAAVARRLRRAVTSLGGSGTLAVQSRRRRRAATTLTSAGTLAVVPKRRRRTATNLAGAATFMVAGTESVAPISGAVALSGTGTMTVTARRARQTRAAFTGTAALAVSVRRRRQAASGMTASASLTVRPKVRHSAAVVLLGHGSLGVAATLGALIVVPPTLAVTVDPVLGLDVVVVRPPALGVTVTAERPAVAVERVQ